MKEGWLLSSLLATVFAFGIGFVFISTRARMLRAVLPEGNTPLSDAGRASVQDPVILTLVRVRFLLTLSIVYDYQARPWHLAFHLARRHRGGPDLRRNGVGGTP